MKNNSKYTPKSFAQWAKRETLSQAQQQSIKGGTFPWIDQP